MNRIFTEDEIEVTYEVLHGIKVLEPTVADKVQEYCAKIEVEYTAKNFSKFREIYIEAVSVFEVLEPYVYVYFIRTITQMNINITYSDVPEFKIHVQTYSPLLRAARQNKGI